jgi:prepilin-type N-terminal cleavage/methylation domain-containing protein
MIKEIKNVKNKIDLNVKQGFTLIELLFYISLFTIFSLIVINSMIFMTSSFRETVINKDLSQGSVILDQISRNVRDASGIIDIGTGSLTLNIPEGVLPARSVQFLLSGSDIELWEDDIFIGNLNPSNLVVSNLIFTQITTANSLAVKVFMSIKSNRYGSERIEDFYTTLVLRHSYD